MEEIYKNCFENYEVSNLGNIRKKIKNGYLELKGSIDNKGYKYFQLQRNGKRENHHIHQLVSKLFIGDYPENCVIDHIDRNKLNNNVNNLRYITQKENCQNTDRYLNDIKETDSKKRAVLRTTKNRQKILEKKIYTCDTCCFITHLKCVFGSLRDYNEHMNSKLHTHRENIIKQMKENNIEVNHTEYNFLKRSLADFKRGKRKTKPLITW